MTFVSSVLLMLLLGGCARLAEATKQGPRMPHSVVTVSTAPSADGPPLVWSSETRSPNPTSIPEELRELTVVCGELDARLNSVAAWLAARGSVGGYDDEIDRITFVARASGTPYIRPAAWSRVSRSERDYAEDSHALSLWLARLGEGRLRRCGLARVHRAEGRLVVAVVSTALADLVMPLPTRARVGQWIELVAELRIEASGAKVVLLGPSGDPFLVPTEQAGAVVRARFPAASPGQWLVQLLVNGRGGPRPVLEALMLVDVPAPTKYRPEPAPGEDTRRADETSTDHLQRMVTLLRAQTGRPILRRDAVLDRLAVAHAGSMRRAQQLGHDVGDGSTQERFASANFEARLAGENVAHAPNAVRAHRALWASPSHRSNLLNRGFSRWGLGILDGEDGSLWICELFASEN